jgi:hypothetical protein
MLTQQGMQNQMGMIPPAPPPPEMVAQQQAENRSAAQQQRRQMDQQVAQEQMGAMPQEAESPINMQQQGPNMGIDQLVERVVAHLDQLPEHEQQAELGALRTNNPQLYTLVLQTLQSRRGAHGNSNAKPAPEKKPPRRGPEATT